MSSKPLPLRLPNHPHSFALQVEGAAAACVVVHNVTEPMAAQIQKGIEQGWPTLSEPVPQPITQHAPLVERFADLADNLLRTTEEGERHPLGDLMIAMDKAMDRINQQLLSGATRNLHPAKLATLRPYCTADLLQLRAIGSSPRQIAMLLNCHAGYFIDDNAVIFTPFPLPDINTQQTNFCVVC